MAFSKNSSLAAPFPDETLYSWLTRFGLLSGFPDHISFLQYFCDYKGQQLTSVFPSYLHNLSKFAEIDPDELIINHSLLPYFRPFSNSQVYENVTSQLKRGEATDAFSQLSLLANRIPESRDLFFCPLCLGDDLRNYGAAYWHVPHQLPWTGTCYLHNIKLQTKKRQRKVLELPPQEVDNSVKEYSTFNEKLTTIATSSYFLWRKNNQHINVDNVVRSYRVQLYRAGLATKTGSVRQDPWRKSLMEFWSGILPEVLDFALFSEKQIQNFPNNLIYQPHAQHHPIKHLLVIVHLYGSWDKFLECFHQEIPISPEEAHLSDLQRSKVIKNRPSIDDALILKKLRQSNSLRNVATLAGVSVSYVKKIAIQNSVAIESRAHRIFQTEKKQILECLQRGEATSTIATAFACGVGVIEQLLSQHPQIVEHRRQLRKQNRRDKHRASILKLVEFHRGIKRGELQSAVRSSYTWLFKHDKQWLYKHLPKAIPHKDRNAHAKTTH
jgi:hypothetical protein